MKKRITSIITTLLVCISAVPTTFTGFAVNDYHPFEGSGTAGDPYQIDSAYKLRLLAEIINDEDLNPDFKYCYYKQTEDIDLKGKPFTPIGVFYGADGTKLSQNALFAGSYDGNFHSISNLYIDYNKKYCGLFGEFGQSGHDNSNVKLKNLSVSGIIRSDSDFVGGVIGELSYGAEVVNCDFIGSVEGHNAVGSIVGKSYCGGNVTSCYGNAEVSSSNEKAEIGGLVGTVSVGYNKNSSSTDTVISNSYFVGSVNTESDISGGIAGQHIVYERRPDSTIEYDNCYYLNTASENAVNGSTATGCFPLSDTMMRSVNEMLGSPFAENTDDSLNGGYPVFEWQITPYQFAGSGTKDDPYQISNKEELEMLSKIVNNIYFNPRYGHAYYLQTADIDLENESWTPIGLGYDGDDGQGAYNCVTRMFFGSYDGGNHYIYNLNVDKPWKTNGLFGVLRGNLSGSYGHEDTGVSNLVVYGSSKNSTNEAGGITSSIHYGASVRNCAFIGDVEGTSYVGGISGTLYAGGTIENCYHIGNVSGKGSGGIVGRINFGKYGHDGENSSVANCYQAGGKVNGSENSGLIAAICVYYNGIDNKVNITNCYGIANSAASNTAVGATSDTTIPLSENLLKKAAEDLGEAFADDSDKDNAGFPVFKWQVKAEGSSGDANGDGQVDLGDAVAILQFMSLPDKYPLSRKDLADVDGVEGISGGDALVIQKVDAGLILAEQLPLG